MILGSGVLSDGRSDLRDRRWGHGQASLTTFLGQIPDDEALVELRGQVQSLFDELGKARDDDDRRARDRTRLETFFKRRREAQIRDAQLAGSALPGHIRATRDAALAALGEFQAGERTLPESFTPEERKEVGVACYEMALILPEAKARPLPGEDPARQVDEALKVLDRAGKLHPKTRAFHLLRASFLAKVGDKRAPTSSDRPPRP